MTNRGRTVASAPNLMSRRTILAGLVSSGFVLSSCVERDAKASGAERSEPVSLSRFGVDRFASRDQTVALRQAFEAAARDRLSLIGDPDATYRYDGRLILDGVSFDGRGCTLLPLSDGPQVLQCRGTGWRLANLRVQGTARTRSSDNGFNGIWIGGDDRDAAANFVLENVTVDGIAPGRGAAAAGIMISNAQQGRLTGTTVRRSLADGIHMTAGSNHLLVEHALIEDSGDDAIAVVSYRRQQQACHHVHVRNATSRRSAARGMTVVGGHDVVFERVAVERSAAAGIYLFGEASFDTYGTARVRVVDSVLTGCVTGVGLPLGYSNAAILLGGRDGTDRVGGGDLPRGASDCLVQNAVVMGTGDACTAAISMHEHAVRSRIVGGNIRGNAPGRAGRASAGIEIGGRDIVVDGTTMTDIAGLAIVVLPTAAGDCRVNRVTVDGSLQTPGPIGSYIYAAQAPALRRLVVSASRFSRGPDRLSISLLPPGRLLFENNAHE